MTTSPATAEAPHTKLDKHVLLVAGVVVLGSIMSILDITVVSVAQDTFQTELKTDQAGAAWTMTAYTLALAAVIPVSAWAASRFGTKKVYLASIVLFLIGSILCAVAWNIESLIAFRAVQGLGGGLLMPIGMMILTKAAGPDLRPHPGRLAHPDRQLALDLPDQRSDRHHRADLRLARPQGRRHR